jgi:glycosyltransferase involved in cell wall biosynthesis
LRRRRPAVIWSCFNSRDTTALGSISQDMGREKKGNVTEETPGSDRTAYSRAEGRAGLVSVVIASYNMARFLPYAIQSAAEQTYRHLEIHVVDDGSTDGTPRVVHSLLEDARVEYHRTVHQGVAAAKNRGIQESTGEYIAFLDADDVWIADKLERQLPLFNRSKDVGVVHSDLIRMNSEGGRIRQNRPKVYDGRVSDRLFVANFVGFSTAIVRKECLSRVGTFDETLPMGIDYDLWLRISAQYEFQYLDEVTTQYRVWGGQISKPSNYRARYQCGARIRRKFLEAHGDLVGKTVRRRAWASFNTNLGNAILSYDKDRIGAARAFFRALVMVPTYVRAWKAMARLLADLGRQVEAG